MIHLSSAENAFTNTIIQHGTKVKDPRQSQLPPKSFKRCDNALCVSCENRVKVKEQGEKRGEIFHVCLLHFPQQGGLQREWATGAEEKRIQT